MLLSIHIDSHEFLRTHIQKITSHKFSLCDLNLNQIKLSQA